MSDIEKACEIVESNVSMEYSGWDLNKEKLIEQIATALAEAHAAGRKSALPSELVRLDCVGLREYLASLVEGEK